jgi:hypothetical protein
MKEACRFPGEHMYKESALTQFPVYFPAYMGQKAQRLYINKRITLTSSDPIHGSWTFQHKTVSTLHTVTIFSNFPASDRTSYAGLICKSSAHQTGPH